MKYPTAQQVSHLMESLKGWLFPDYFENQTDLESSIEELLGKDVSVKFIEALPKLRDELMDDAKAMAHKDPAVEDIAEVVICYPFMTAIIHYRIAHELYRLGVSLLPRMITEMAHSATGIDIHPAAQIGRSFCIDHGTGVVIGETTIIGDNVMLYQGVTLGAKNFKYDKEGYPVDEPRHPIIEDNVTIYSNTSVLGRIRIGHDTIIGGNIWLTHDVPPGSRLVQGKPKTEPQYSDNAAL